ncbi:MAG: hypothetical protein KAQ99_00135 [Candidatus Aureabacteria bacterium]|nr:hypothetical protein [Candidatus Auribacterota bacterium]MCK5159958.1 hypothetical protein [Candidatus Auribacterota bacterium]
MKNVLKVILETILKIVVILIISIISLFVVCRNMLPWPKLLAEVQLEPSRPILYDEDITEDNAFYYIRQINSSDNEIGEASKEYDRFVAYEWEEGKYPLLEKWVDNNADEVALCRKAAEIQECQVATAISFETLLPYLSPIRDKVKVLSFIAERDAAKGNWQSVLDSYKTMLIVGDHLSRGGCLINYLVDTVCTNVACQSMRKVVLQHKAPESVLNSMISMVGQIDKKNEPFAEVLRYERMAAKNITDTTKLAIFKVNQTFPAGWLLIADLKEQNVNHSGKISMRKAVADALGSTPEKINQTLDAVYSHLIDIASGPYDPDRFNTEILQYIEKHAKHPFLMLFSGDPVGRMLVSLHIPALNNALSYYNRHLANLRGTALFLAVRLYQDKNNGNPPASLLELSPEYIDKIPEDPFSKGNEPFKYIGENGSWKIYSVGANQSDNGGQYNFLISSQLLEHEDELDICFSSDELILRQKEYQKKAQKR